jgi:chemosensory pili system protein ChpC
VKTVAHNPVHALEVPNHALPLLLPSACMAEVVPYSQLAPVPQAPPWFLGVLGWRLRPVPVFSYEALAGGEPAAPGPRSRVVVLYPLPGRESWEFVGVLSSAEPQSRLIDASATPVAVQDAYPCIASGLRFDNRLVGIPDFTALARILYPA